MTDDSDSEAFYLIAVHGGAGHHPKSLETQTKKALKLACKQVVKSLQQSASAVSAVEEAICVLEDDPCLNAGYGSNLTLTGDVECDASIMDGRSQRFGSVGAVAGFRHPIKLARAVLDNSQKADVLGRIPPLTVVSEGAKAFAATQNSQALSVEPPNSLVSPRALLEWTHWKARLDSLSEGHIADTQLAPDEALHLTSEHMSAMQDTVGAIACDSGGNLASGVSSGGLLLKHPGRIGEAAIYGAGCWVSQSTENSKCESTSSISGAGEGIMQTLLAKTLGATLDFEGGGDIHDTLKRTLQYHSHEIVKRRGQLQSDVGLILLTRAPSKDGEIRSRLWCAFTAESMAIAYASSLDPKPQAVIIRRYLDKIEDDTQFCITCLPLSRI